MIELVRIIQDQTILYGYRATQHADRAEQLELMIETTKPKRLYAEWHPLIATPFKHSPPLPHARFRPPYGKNIFYGSLIEETALYEHAFHFMKERKHLDVATETGTRTIFFVNAKDDGSVHIREEGSFLAIMDKNDYSASHQFITDKPAVTCIIYPSCRDPEHRDNVAILDIKHLEKYPTWETSIKFFYDNRLKQITWVDYKFHVKWSQVV